TLRVSAHRGPAAVAELQKIGLVDAGDDLAVVELPLAQQRARDAANRAPDRTTRDQAHGLAPECVHGRKKCAGLDVLGLAIADPGRHGPAAVHRKPALAPGHGVGEYAKALCPISPSPAGAFFARGATPPWPPPRAPPAYRHRPHTPACSADTRRFRRHPRRRP